MKIAKGSIGPLTENLQTLLLGIRMPIERACEVAEGLIALQNENEKFILVAQPMLNGRTSFTPKDEDYEDLNRLWTMEVEIDFPVLEMDMLKESGGEIDPVTLMQLINIGVLSLNGTPKE